MGVMVGHLVLGMTMATMVWGDCEFDNDPFIFRVEHVVEGIADADRLRRACGPLEVNVVDDPGLVNAVSNTTYWSPWLSSVDTNGTIPSSEHIDACVDAQRHHMKSMAIGTAENVVVVGGVRRRKVMRASTCDVAAEVARRGDTALYVPNAYKSPQRRRFVSFLPDPAVI